MPLFSPQRIHRFIIFFILLTLSIAAIRAVFNSNWVVVFIAIVTAKLTLLPDIMQKRFSIVLPVEFALGIVVFIYATLFLGEAGDFYNRFWWWDVVIHASSAIAFGLIGVIVLYMLLRSDRLRANAGIMAFFAFTFALAIGALWEIFEFFMDQVFGLSMQKSGLVDTMWDLIINSIGAFSAALSGYFYFKGEREGILVSSIENFISKNKSKKIKPII